VEHVALADPFDGPAEVALGRVLQQLRTEVFLAPEGRIALRPDASQRLMALVNRLFGAGAVAVAPTQPAVPMAMPVQPAQPLVAQPCGSRRRRGPPRHRQLGLRPRPPLPGPARKLPSHRSGHDVFRSRLYRRPRPAQQHSQCDRRDHYAERRVVRRCRPVVGKEAVLASAMEPEKIAQCVKRDMVPNTIARRSMRIHAARSRVVHHSQSAEGGR